MDASALTKGQGLAAALRHLWPYLLMLVLATVAVGWTDLRPQTSRGMWYLTTLVYAAIAIWRVWAEGGAGRLRETLRQVAHWAMFLGAMLLLDVPALASQFGDDARALLLLILLGLATLLDGLYVDWRFCVVGALLGVGAAVLAFFDQAAVAITVAFVGALAVLVAIQALERRAEPIRADPGVR